MSDTKEVPSKQLQHSRQPYYDSDLTDEEWQQIEPLLPPEKPVGKDEKWTHETCSTPFSIEVIFLCGKPCMGTSDCGSDYGCGSRLIGFWCSECEKREVRAAEPSLAIIDSQSIKLGQKAGGWCLEATSRLGIEHPAGKNTGSMVTNKVKGHKRHMGWMS